MQAHFKHLRLRFFLGCKELFNLMSFDPYNRLLKIRKSMKTPIPKVGAHLGVWGFIPLHFPTILGGWNVTPELQYLPTPLPTLALVMSPKLRLWYYEFTSYLFIHTSGCPWPSVTLVHVLETFNFFYFYFYVFFIFIIVFYILDASLKFGERRHTSFFFK